MAKQLTQAQLDRLRPREKPYKAFDTLGLYLVVNPSGRHYWRFKYRFEGREKTLSLGVYPDVRLSAARKKRDAARRMIAEDGIDPSARRQAEKLATENTFKALAEEWLHKGCPGKGSKGRPKDATIDQLRHRLTKYAYPWIGNKPMPSITLDDMRSLLDRISRKGTHETANRVRSLCDRVFRFAIASGRAERNLAADLRDAVPVADTKNFAAITDPREFGGLLRAIEGYEGQPATMSALRLAPLVFVRPGELRTAEWSEFDLDAAKWSIPAEK
ncbi:MAG: integrase arm-type DNA-binding domain-containing protein, partial [Woeseia sp.]